MRVRPSDAFTFLSLMAGVLAVVIADSGSLLWAGIMLVLAACADWFDGRVARKLGHESPFGTYLDSLADICSFGFAPITIAFLVAGTPAWLVVAGILYLGAGVYRLARFQASAERSSFRGMPITMNGVFFPLVFFAPHDWVFAAYFLLSAMLMVSTLRVGKL